MRVTAAVLYDAKKPVVIEDVELLEPGPHEVQVRWAANGVCHSDLHVITGDYPHPLPVVLGHEAAGVVEKVGPGVETVAPGDHVCSSYIPSCGKCRYCINGQPTLCALRDRPRWFMLDGTPRFRRNGQPLHHFLQVSGYATHSVLPEDSVNEIARGMLALVASACLFVVVGQPVRTLIFVGALNGLILPISLGVMLVAGSTRRIVGSYRHPLWLTIAGGVVAASMAAMGVWSLATQIPLLFR